MLPPSPTPHHLFGKRNPHRAPHLRFPNPYPSPRLLLPPIPSQSRRRFPPLFCLFPPHYDASLLLSPPSCLSPSPLPLPPPSSSIVCHHVMSICHVDLSCHRVMSYCHTHIHISSYKLNTISFG